MDADATLLERSRHSDSEAFGQLVHRYRNRLLAAMTQFSGCSEEAEDVVQETFVQAYLQLKRFRGHSAFYTWLYRIAMNRAISRRRRVRPTCSLELEHVEQVTAEYSPSRGLECAEQKRQVQHALSGLSEMHQAILRMREWQDLDYEAIAKRLDVSVGTVKSRLYRARLSLRDNLLDAVTLSN